MTLPMSALPRRESDRVVIYSTHHRQYWRQQGEGLTDDIRQAGVFPRPEANCWSSVEGLELHPAPVTAVQMARALDELSEIGRAFAMCESVEEHDDEDDTALSLSEIQTLGNRVIDLVRTLEA